MTTKKDVFAKFLAEYGTRCLINLFSRIRGIVKQGLGNLFITSFGFDFTNKTDLEQYSISFYLPSTAIYKKMIQNIIYLKQLILSKLKLLYGWYQDFKKYSITKS